MKRLEKNINVRMPEDQMVLLKNVAERQGLGYSAYVRYLIFKDLKQFENLAG